MAATASKCAPSALAPRAEQLALPLGTLLGGILRTTRARMDARIAEEARLWAGYCQNGTEWLLDNTEEA